MLTNRVGRSAPFQRTTENVLNPLPMTASVSGARVGAYVRRLGGADVGAGLVTETNDASARSSLIRGIVIPPRNRSSRIGRPVLRRLARISDTLALGAAWRSTAQAPATCGVAIDVPLDDA